MKFESITICGPTACGKTARAVGLAQILNAEIISADSRQVYRDMDLGTGKDIEEYGDVPYHLINIVDAGEKYDLHRYLDDFHSAYQHILHRNRLPIICGGSGMYLENAVAGIKLPDVGKNEPLRRELEGKSLDELAGILRSYKPLHNITDIDNARRAIRAIEIESYYAEHPHEARKAQRDEVVPLNTLIIGLDIPRDDRRRRITERLHSRLKAGMVDEVNRLLQAGVKADDLIYYGLEYKYVTLHAIGKLTFEEMFEQLELAIHQFAKRQMTWFRGMERRGFHINWIPYNISQQEFNERVLSLCNNE